MRKILLTGFEAFNSLEENPSEKLVKRLDGEIIQNHEIVSKVVPVKFEDCFQEIRELLENEDFDLVLNIGVYGGENIEIAKASLNLMDAPYPDESGFQPSNQKISDKGEQAYFSNLDFSTLERKEIDLSPTLSDCFVCNNLAYLTFKKLEDKSAKYGALHIPLMPGNFPEKDTPDMKLDKSTDEIRKIIRLSLDQ